MKRLCKVEAVCCDQTASGKDPKANLDRNDRGCLYTLYHTMNMQNCQSFGDVLTLEDALDLACSDTEVWIEERVRRCMMTPGEAAAWGYCPAWLPAAYAEACRERDMPMREY